MQRADVLLVDRQQAKTRTHAQRLIKEGSVSYTDGNKTKLITKPGLKLSDEVVLHVVESDADKYVSRGALKLEGALNTFGINPVQMNAIDIGQSTGGFTDCLLQHGASTVVGIEVGHDQLDASLRNDPRITCYEGMNARALPASLLQHTPADAGFDLAVMDVSFISQTKILPSLVPLLKTGGSLISLIKPQFEVGKAGIGKGGIVKDSSLFNDVEQLIRASCAELNLSINGYIESPITGGDGNREFLMWAQKK